jgi:hypothetical protein
MCYAVASSDMAIYALWFDEEEGSELEIHQRHVLLNMPVEWL